MKKSTGAILALFIIASVNAYSQADKAKMVMGYLSDVKCATSPNGISADGFDLSANPEKHTTACLKMKSCEASGYGIFLKSPNGKYTFTKFDSKGNDLAKAYLKKTKRKDGLIIDVMGKLEKSVLKVESIKEATEGMDMGDMKM